MNNPFRQKINVDDIFFDKELYPRSQFSNLVAYDYSQSMRTGAKFPPIVIAIYDEKKYLVDGKHRLEANKILKNKEIEADVFLGWNKEKIYREGVRYNIANGKSLTPYEKRVIALKLMQMNLKNSEISTIIQVPEDKLEKFVGQRLISTLTGEENTSEGFENIAKEIGKSILKSGIKQYAGMELEEGEFNNIQEVQKTFNTGSQRSLFGQVVDILQNNLLDKKDVIVMKLFKKLKKLIKNYD